MRVIVAVCVYNRTQNIKHWINCWQQSNTENAELVIIHNHYNEEGLKEKFQTLCEKNNVRYVPRNRQGIDIGAYQDVVKERLLGFPNDWDFLLWCTDDCLPTSKDFIAPFIEKLQDESNGCACMQISKSTPGGILHVRTTGFCISKEISKKLRWPVDPITTKQHCYLFEHRGGKDTLSEQIRAMGLNCVQVSPVKDSPLWDSLHPNTRLRLDRQAEFNKVWGVKEHTPKVLFIVPIFNMYPAILHSLIPQTHENWELLLIHNGPLNDHVYDIPKDKRVKFIVHPEATGKWGHVLRQKYLEEIKDRDDVDYVVISNADNYYAPAFINSLLTGFKKPDTVASYCENMVHSYTGWGVLKVRFERGYIDCGGVMVKKDVACEIGWRDVEGHSSDWTYFQDIAKKYNQKNFVSVPGCLFTHN